MFWDSDRPGHQHQPNTTNGPSLTVPQSGLPPAASQHQGNSHCSNTVNWRSMSATCKTKVQEK